MHNKEGWWLHEIEKDSNRVRKQEALSIMFVMTKKTYQENAKLEKAREGQGYWFKSVKAINQYWQHYLMKHFKVGMYLNRLQPENEVTNFHPIPCCPIMRKLLTAMVLEDLYKQLE